MTQPIGPNLRLNEGGKPINPSTGSQVTRLYQDLSTLKGFNLRNAADADLQLFLTIGNPFALFS